jgi:alpha-L-rhamnosidase
MVNVSGLRCNHMVTPLTVGPEAPLLSWQLASGDRDVKQEAYRIRVSTAEGLAWDSGPVGSTSQAVSYGGPPLASQTLYSWSVTATTGSGEESHSGPAWFETGLLKRADWQASWITLPRPGDSHDDIRPAPYLRRAFVVDGELRRARLYITAAGLYEATLNGVRVSDDQLTPGWTDYARRVNYQSYDVTALVRAGPNVIGAVLADGWYSGRVGLTRTRELYGSGPALLAQLVLDWSDGIRTTVGSDEQWRATFGPLMASDLLMGQTYDARRELGAWHLADYDDAAWRPAVRVAGPVGVLAGQPCAPVTAVAQLHPIALSEPIPGSYVFDLGQNMVGRVRLRLKGPAGTITRVRYGEVLSPDGALYTENLRGARATDTYIKGADAPESWEPAFTVHGFRYAELTGCPQPPTFADVTGIVVSSIDEASGEFDCSDPLVRQLQHNIVWGQRGNFVEVPTDCPQRDERLGWMGDAQVFVATACFNADVAAFLTKWTTDVFDAQSPEGAFPDVAPLPPRDTVVDLAHGAPGWGDAGVIVPWSLYHCYGDRRILELAYQPSIAWIHYIRSRNPDLIWRVGRGNDYGDWLAVDADTPKEVVATAYFARSARLVARMGSVLGRADEAKLYDGLADDIAAAFRAAFVTSEGRVLGNTQTGYALALRFGLLTEDQRIGAARWLAADIEARDWHMSTGFLGVGHLLPALTDIGRIDLAYRLLLQETFPSWGYAIRRGATTIWERWDGLRPDGTLQDPAMNSFNHYALGSVGEWLYTVVGGLRCHQDSAGWEHIVVQPHSGGNLTWASCRYESVRGPVACRWELDGERLSVEVEIPAGSIADVVLPCAAGQAVTGLSDVHIAEGLARARIGSGSYRVHVGPSTPVGG